MKHNVKLKIENGKLLIALLALFTVHCSLFTVSAQSGGTFDLSHSVIAGGGGSNSTGGTFNVSGTVGQNIAGTASNGATYDLHGGFWFQNLAPTAAGVSVSGRVMTANGNGIRNVIVTLADASGLTRRAISSSFGYYRFDDVEAGQNYVISVRSKRFTFANPTRILSVQDELTDVDFTAEPQ
jgi:hypothetical protein